VTANSTVDEIIPLTVRASIYGLITLPRRPRPAWTRPKARRTEELPTVFGGASFHIANPPASYSLYAVAPARYTLSAQSQEYPAKEHERIVGSQRFGHPTAGGAWTFSTFSVGELFPERSPFRGYVQSTNR